MLGILVEEALTSRNIFELQSSNDPSKKNLFRKENNLDNISITHNNVDELISDKAITYNRKKMGIILSLIYPKILTRSYLNSLNNVYFS